MIENKGANSVFVEIVNALVYAGEFIILNYFAKQVAK